MNTHLEVTSVEPGVYSVKAIEGHVVTRQRLAVDQGYLEQTGRRRSRPRAGGVRHPAGDTKHWPPSRPCRRIEQLVAQYPYLSSELQKRFPPGTPGSQPVEPARIAAAPAGGPSHPHLTAGLRYRAASVDPLPGRGPPSDEGSADYR